MPTRKPFEPMKAENFDTDPAQNVQPSPIGAPEGPVGGTTVEQLNNIDRYDKAAEREVYDWIEALDTGFGIDHEQQTNAVSEINNVHPVATQSADGFIFQD